MPSEEWKPLTTCTNEGPAHFGRTRSKRTGEGIRPQSMLPIVAEARSRDIFVRALRAPARCAILGHGRFQVLDQSGVGGLITQAVVGGRTVRPQPKVYTCGEHGSEPR